MHPGQDRLRAAEVTSCSHGVFSDDQPFIALLACWAQGVTGITDTVWTNRFGYCPAWWTRLPAGAAGARVEITGPQPPVRTDRHISAHDLRASAALLLAAAAVPGRTAVSGTSHLIRGYPDLPGSLRSLGGQTSARQPPHGHQACEARQHCGNEQRSLHREGQPDVLNTKAEFDSVTDPFVLHLAQGALSARTGRPPVRNPTPGWLPRIAVSDPDHDKQYAMNLRYLQQDTVPCPDTDELHPAWADCWPTCAARSSPAGWRPPPAWSCANSPWTSASTPTMTATSSPSTRTSRTRRSPVSSTSTRDGRNWPAASTRYGSPAIPGASRYAESHRWADSSSPSRRPSGPGTAVSTAEYGGVVTRLTVQLEYWLGDAR